MRSKRKSIVKKLKTLLWVVLLLVACDNADESDKKKDSISNTVNFEIYLQDQEIIVGSSLRLKLLKINQNGEKEEVAGSITWLSSKIEIISIDDQGVLTAHSQGEANIIAKYKNKSISKKVQVKQLENFNKIKISEVFYDAEGSDNGKEFIEIYNFSEDDVNISGCLLVDGSLSSKAFVFDSNTIISAKSFIVIAQNYEVFKEIYGNLKINLVANFDFILNNNGETILLYAPNNSIIDYVYIESGTTDFPVQEDEWQSSNKPSASSGFSIQRDLEDFNTNTYLNWEDNSGKDPTPGFK
jgi:hypothetical protein